MNDLEQFLVKAWCSRCNRHHACAGTNAVYANSQARELLVRRCTHVSTEHSGQAGELLVIVRQMLPRWLWQSAAHASDTISTRTRAVRFHLA